MEDVGPVAPASAWKPAVGLAVAVAVFHSALFVVVPYEQQDFPLSDDWAYALGAFSFLRGDGPRYCDWSANPLLGQWIWSAPFVFVLGETHQALRISTATLHAVFAVALILLLVRCGTRQGRLIATLIVFHPIVCLCSVTFLSDLPSLAFALAAIACWMTPRSAGAVVCGLIFGSLAVINRQSALAAPVAILASAVLARERSTRLGWAPQMLVAILGFVVFWWFSFQPDAARHPLRIPGVLDVVDVFAWTLLFGGLGLFPVLISLASRKRLLAGVGVMSLFWILWAAAFGFRSDWNSALFPFPQNHGNLLTDDGPFGDVFTVGASHPMFNAPIRWILTVLAIVGGGALIATASLASWRQWRHPVVLFGIAQLALPLVSQSQFDRYFIPLLIAAAFLLPTGEVFPAPRRRWSAVAAVIWIGLSFVICRELLTINAAKWKLGRRALASGVARPDIEGGLEWDFHHAWKNGRPPRVAGPQRRGFAVPFSLERLPHLTGRYAVSLSPDPRFETIDRIVYRRWLPWREEEVVLIKAW